jgi:putative hydrolase of the HAD superfamily
MSRTVKPTALFLDIGGVLLSNGWDHNMRARAAAHFELDLEEMNERHHLTYDTYEEGKLSLDSYLDRIVFYRPRPFDKSAFKAFIQQQASSHDETIDFFLEMKRQHNLTVAAVSNEGRELMEDRITRFDLHRLVDFFIGSCYVHIRKPDVDVYRLALDVAQLPARDVIYVDDRAMFVEVAEDLGLRGIVHESVGQTHQALAQFGLTLDPDQG